MTIPHFFANKIDIFCFLRATTLSTWPTWRRRTTTPLIGSLSPWTTRFNNSRKRGSTWQWASVICHLLIVLTSSSTSQLSLCSKIIIFQANPSILLTCAWSLALQDPKLLQFTRKTDGTLGSLTPILRRTGNPGSTTQPTARTRSESRT